MSFLGIKDVTISHRKYSAQIRKKSTGIYTINNHDPDNKGIDSVVTYLSKFLF